MRAVILTGAPGAGKSSAVTALSDLLAADEVPHVTVELDDLARGWPWRHPPESFPALAAFVSAARTDLLLTTATITSATELAGLLGALGCEEHLLVRLHASPATLVRRLRAREAFPWSGLEALVERTPALQDAIAALPGVHLALDSEAASPMELARVVRKGV